MAGYAQAQLRFGARAGLFYMNEVYKFDEHKNFENYYNIPAFQLGAVSEYAVGDAFSVQLGLLFAQMRHSYKWWNKNGNSEYNDWGKRTVNFIQIPVNFQYGFDLNGATLTMQTGLYFGYFIGGEEKWAYERSGYYSEKESGYKKIEFGNDREKHYWKPLDYGLGLGIGLRASNIQFGLNYNIGLANLSNRSAKDYTGSAHDEFKVKYKFNNVMFNISYFFGN